MSLPINIFVILGPSGSGRRALLPNLVRDGLGDGELPAAILVWSGEPDHGPDSVPRGLANTWFATYDFAPAKTAEGLPVPLAVPVLPEATRTLFLLAPGSGDPRDFIEAFHAWLATSGHELGRILLNSHCRLLHDHPETATWFECCAHFADVVLLNQRQDINSKWIREYELSFGKKRMPLLVFFVKKDRLDRADLALMPQARRMCLLFDPVEEIEDLTIETSRAPVSECKAVIDDDTEFDFDPAELEDDGDETSPAEDEEPAEDEWLARDSRGIRKVSLPELPKA